ncbi:hypothetical protein [Bradyrhizobium campsiandrae]|uniref:Uncharacterized protein n=1 Tax=Bradyrhizobium campsiandrae TaxID=1729892 RepID=A0ABR7U809_9BRAD|nr:hypothetical protein [Bradyrhizobium campsiandrae]MBC9980107.1 hypothetical protein [Bradyrhizobium campsiandrae]
MRKPTQVLFGKRKLKSIDDIEHRLAAVNEMQRLLELESSPPLANSAYRKPPAKRASARSNEARGD